MARKRNYRIRDLSEVQRLFEQWRQTRRGKTRIPEELWSARATTSKSAILWMLLCNWLKVSSSRQTGPPCGCYGRDRSPRTQLIGKMSLRHHTTFRVSIPLLAYAERRPQSTTAALIRCITTCVLGAVFLFQPTLWSMSEPPSPTQVSSRPTRLVVLGVSHAAQLVAKSYQPAVFRAFFDRVRPAAICIERDPENYARHDFYEFTYEQQNIVIPWAEQTRTPVFPVDWIPPTDDQLLAWNTPDIGVPGFLRNPGGFQGFLAFEDAKDLVLNLFFAESPDSRKEVDSWYDSARAPGRQDFARRLELYRTFMQAMRVRNVAERFKGQTLLVVVGYMHKYDIERSLTGQKDLEIVQPSAFGAPTDEEIQKQVTLPDLFAIATFNLLGVQPLTKNVAWEWVDEVLAQLESRSPGTETALLRTKFKVLRGTATPQGALANYAELIQRPDADETFTYTGVIDRRRVDSFFDPFGDLTIRQRLMLELARENAKIHELKQAESWKNKLSSSLSEMQRSQLQGYWQRYVEAAP